MMGFGRTIGSPTVLVDSSILSAWMERAEQPFTNLLQAGLALLLCISPEVRLAHDAANALVEVVNCTFAVRYGPGSTDV